MQLTLEVEQEDDGRWLAEVVQLPGALAYGATAGEALAKAEALALRVLAERLEHGEAGPLDIRVLQEADPCGPAWRGRGGQAGRVSR